jgi:hypothetical protein
MWHSRWKPEGRIQLIAVPGSTHENQLTRTQEIQLASTGPTVAPSSLQKSNLPYIGNTNGPKSSPSQSQLAIESMVAGSFMSLFDVSTQVKTLSRWYNMVSWIPVTISLARSPLQMLELAGGEASKFLGNRISHQPSSDGVGWLLVLRQRPEISGADGAVVASDRVRVG